MEANPEKFPLVKAPIIEIFSSIQGEGPLLGCRQVFLRFALCNLRCAYCDTLHSPVPAFCRIEQNPSQPNFIEIANPLTLEITARWLNLFGLNYHHSLSLTGGEPLLHIDFLLQLLPLINKTREGIYLETNGTLPEALEKILDLVDFIAMDIKIPSTSGFAMPKQEHRDFLQLARKKICFVKVIIGSKTSPAEIEKVINLIKEAKAEIPLILQPVAPNENINTIPPSKALDLQMLALKKLPYVRLIPQIHKTLNLL